MSFGDIRVCWNCRNLWVEDDHQQEDVDRCPTCGAHANMSTGYGDGFLRSGGAGTDAEPEPDPEPEELVADGSFENYSGGLPPDWSEYSEPVSGINVNGPASGLIRTGSYSISPSNLSSGECYAYQDIQVTPGQSYSLSFWTMGSGSVGGRYSVYDNINEAHIIDVTATGVTEAEYSEVADSFVAPAGCTSIQIRLWAPDSSGEATFDDVSLKAA